MNSAPRNILMGPNLLKNGKIEVNGKVATTKIHSMAYEQYVNTEPIAMVDLQNFCFEIEMNEKTEKILN